jgi:hypothetical protein
VNGPKPLDRTAPRHAALLAASRGEAPPSGEEHASASLVKKGYLLPPVEGESAYRLREAGRQMLEVWQERPWRKIAPLAVPTETPGRGRS